MKNNNVLIVGFFLSVLIVSCSQSAIEEVSDNKSYEEKRLKSANETHIDKNTSATKKELEKNKDRPTLFGNRTVSFNGEKYLVDGAKLRKGSQVRNIHMSEKGRIKGTFVVVLKAGETLDISFKSMTKIAKDTFRLIPAQTDDLMAIYNELLLNKSIARVELEIVYSGEKSDVATY